MATKPKQNYSKLSPKQEQSCHDFIETGNKTEAYRRSYSTKNMTENTLNCEAVKHFHIPKVSQRVAKLQEIQAKKNEISKEWIFEQLKSVIAKSSSEEEIKGPDGTTGEFKYDSSGVNKAIDTLNKMMGYYAPTKTEHSGEVATKRVIELHPTKDKE